MDSVGLQNILDQLAKVKQDASAVQQTIDKVTGDVNKMLVSVVRMERARRSRSSRSRKRRRRGSSVRDVTLRTARSPSAANDPFGEDDPQCKVDDKTATFHLSMKKYPLSYKQCTPEEKRLAWIDVHAHFNSNWYGGRNRELHETVPTLQAWAKRLVRNGRSTLESPHNKACQYLSDTGRSNSHRFPPTQGSNATIE